MNIRTDDFIAKHNEFEEKKESNKQYPNKRK